MDFGHWVEHLKLRTFGICLSVQDDEIEYDLHKCNNNWRLRVIVHRVVFMMNIFSISLFSRMYFDLFQFHAFRFHSTKCDLSLSWYELVYDFRLRWNSSSQFNRFTHRWNALAGYKYSRIGLMCNYDLFFCSFYNTNEKNATENWPLSFLLWLCMLACHECIHDHDRITPTEHWPGIKVWK